MKWERVIITSAMVVFFSACQHQEVSIEEVQVEKPSTSEAPTPPTEKKDYTFSTHQQFNPLANSQVQAISPEQNIDFQQLLPVAQSFQYQASMDTVIYGSSGSILAIPAYSLQTKDGKEISGTVEIQLTEYVKPSQFAAENLITRTTDGILLETVGMLNIVALQGQDTLQLKDKHPISIAFPLKNTRKDFQVWDAMRNAQGMAEWKLQNNLDTLTAIQNRKINVQMVLHAGDAKNQAVRMQTCSGAGWQNYFNRRFVFPENLGQELQDENNFLAYAFKVNKSGKVINVFVEENLYSKEVYNLSKKYEIYVENFLKKYPKLNLCKVQDAHKRTFRFKVMPGAAHNPLELIYVQPDEGGYTTEELAEMYSQTGESIYLDAWMNRTGSQSKAGVPQTKEKRSTAIMNAALGVIGGAGRTILNVASLGLINGDACANIRVKSKFKSAALLKVFIQGTGAAVYMVFKNVRSFLKGTVNEGGLMSFGERLPPGQEVYLVALSEIDGKQYMSRMDYITDSQTIQMEPTTPFDLMKFQQWLDNEPGTGKANKKP